MKEGRKRKEGRKEEGRKQQRKGKNMDVGIYMYNVHNT